MKMVKNKSIRIKNETISIPIISIIASIIYKDFKCESKHSRTTVSAILTEKGYAFRIHIHRREHT